MKILVTGVGGQLGYDVCRRLTQLGIEHKGVDVQDFDLTNADAVMDAVRAYAPDAITIAPPIPTWRRRRACPRYAPT